MKNKLLAVTQIFRNMGLRYVAFRSGYALQRKFGILEMKFPVNPPNKTFIKLEEWRENTPIFFFDKKETLAIPIQVTESLADRVHRIKHGELLFFSHLWLSLDKENPWHTNPDSGYTYDKNKHWSKIEDYSKEAGDIKFVWEKARFSWLYDVIRYDFHSNSDESNFVFQKIEDFIDNNPINQGPQYRCSQEISLRILNWTFALYYYKNSENLSEAVFKKIVNSIYWQLQHVYHNIHFSRIAVRNNHAITETLMLYVSGLLFPFIPETKKWSKKGKNWFEKEIGYQIYEDGTYLQFSMNYHRVVIQLLTWGIRLAELNNDTFNRAVYDRAEKSLQFLRNAQDATTGKLPNYGSNDGALFFPLTDDDYRVYTSQLNDLAAVLQKPISKKDESQAWYGLKELGLKTNEKNGLNVYRQGGFAILQEESTKTFLHCGSYKDRPAQADNNHLDIWHEGKNYFRDAGSYKYNTNQELLQFFMGTQGHNAVMIEDQNQMLKGSRFIWFHWSKNAHIKTNETDDYYELIGTFEGFGQIKSGIKHKRKKKKYKGKLHWIVTDTFFNADDLRKTIFWHPNPKEIENISLTTQNLEKQKLRMDETVGWYSSYYGEKEKALVWEAKSDNGFITEIKIEG